MPPFVITLAIEAAAQERFDAQRRRYFPPDRLVVGAHVTLFHAVPDDVDVDPDLRAATDRAAFDVQVTEVMSLGRGTAYRMRSADLAAIHRELQRRWEPRLTAQDRQSLRAHVTVENKVSPERARQTANALRATFAPFDVRAEGLALWRYDGGPWTFVRRYGFNSPGSTSS